MALNLNIKIGPTRICYILSPKKELLLRIFIAAFCVGCLFGKLISNNKLRFPKVNFQFIVHLQTAVLSASLKINDLMNEIKSTKCQLFGP